MKLIQVNDEESVTLPEDVNKVVGDIHVARFVLENPKQYYGQKFYCYESNGFTSPNDVSIQKASGNDYFVGEWSEWAGCTDVKHKTNRTRTKGNGEKIFQKRYCRCSDLKELPSPRYTYACLLIALSSFTSSNGKIFFLPFFLESCYLEKPELENQHLEISFVVDLTLLLLDMAGDPKQRKYPGPHSPFLVQLINVSQSLTLQECLTQTAMTTNILSRCSNS